MEPKYYIPSIEEFYIGFEYEEYVAGSNHDYLERSFGSADSDMPFIKNLYKQNLQEGWVKVKYLDREDIESLGWEFIQEHKTYSSAYHWIEFKKKNPEVRRGSWNEEYRLRYQLGIEDYCKLDIDNCESYEDNKIYFDGTIKNKSELKMILKMIGI